jgi:hypothetical protein
MPPVVTGARSTATIADVQRKHDMDNLIKVLDPDQSRFTTLTTHIGKKPTTTPDFKQVEDDYMPRFDAVNNGAGYTNSATVVAVDNGPYFYPDVLAVVTRTGEVIRVVSVSSNNLTVVRGIGSTAQALVDNDELAIIANALPEGSLAPTPRSTQITTRTNYTQIFRKTWASTGTNIATDDATTPQDWDHQVKMKTIEHKRDLEMALKFGKASEDLSNPAQPRRTTGGLLANIVSNVQDAGGALTLSEFNSFMQLAFTHGSKTKWALAAPNVVQALQTFPQSFLHVTQSEKVFGMDVMTFQSPFGVLKLIIDWDLQGSKYGGYLIVVDGENVKYRPLVNSKANRDTHMNENIQAPDYDGKMNEMLTEAGLDVSLEKTHALLVGVVPQ